ncbi:Kinesin- protein 6 [Physocladia obscura]|uniref:Alpha-galactosidase n=1 Tax=Physocladia obscura TaxID=109957 RepID=A0AAD5XFW3_9FUNG|nr:Kinesin- protein 6 [Physocladia obscura]
MASRKITISERLDREDNGEDTIDSNDDNDGQSVAASDGLTTNRVSKQATIKIFVRVRPPFKNAKLNLHSTPGRYYTVPESESEADGSRALPRIGFVVPKDEGQGLINNQKENYNYAFNRVFDQSTSQEEIFDHVAKDVILSAMDGYNGTIFAYGQTGSGKTFTITGGAERYSDRGIIPRTLQFIFKEAKARTNHHYEIEISYLEIYKESGYDLLDSTRDAKKLEDLPKVRLQEDENQTIHVQNLSTVAVVNEEEALNLLFVGDTNKMIAETPSNPASSRSHCIFIVNIVGKREGEDRMWRSKLHLVDLAGSERVSRTGITGNLFKEASCINLSLHFLEQVIVALHEKAQGKRTHVPYRNSMMTSILRDSLGGNCMTTMISTVAPEDELIDESISTCRFAQRVALISNKAELNEEIDPKLIIAKLKREIVRLKSELAIARGETGGDSSEELPEYEIDRIRQAVEDYLADTSITASLIFSDARKINEAYRILKTFALNGKLATNMESVTPASNPVDSEKLSSKEAEKLKMLITHRDNEIVILIEMINKYKSQLGESNLMDAHHLKKISSFRTIDTSRAPSQISQIAVDQSKISINSSATRADAASAITPNLASSMPQLSMEKAKLFEVFKKDYPGTSLIDEQKVALKAKYAEAKKLGEIANELRLGIKHAKDTLGQPDDGDQVTVKLKQELRNSMAEKVSSYKRTYQDLKDLKLEIEHMQHLLEQGRLRLSRAFEQWHDEVYLTTLQPLHTEQGMEIDPPSKIPNYVLPRTIETAEYVRNSVSRPPSSLKAEMQPSSSKDLASRSKLINDAQSLFASGASPYSSTSTLFLSETPILHQSMPRKTIATFSGENSTAWQLPSSKLQASSCNSRTEFISQDSLGHLKFSSRSQTPILKSGSETVQTDIDAFYKAREKLLGIKSRPNSSGTSEYSSGVIVGVQPLPKGTPDNGVGRTPAMGWNSWNKFGCSINENLIRSHADALVATGLAALGYNHVNVDDCWQLSRNASGYIQEDPAAFPSGIKTLSDYVHSKGLKFGLYSSAGTLTCQRRPGGLHFEKQDAESYAYWEIDYFKYDNCFNEGLSSKEGAIQRYGALRDALNATGRHINYALCSWGEANIWEFGDELGNSWRTTGDISDGWQSVADLLQKNLLLSKWAKPGGFNDMDMLEVGNGGMTDTEYRSHFAIWAALKSPLLLGNDITNMSPETVQIIGNEDIIAINQDSLGKSAFLRGTLDNILVWVGELANGDRVLLVFNGDNEKVANVDVSLRVFTDGNGKTAHQSDFWTVEVRDLWKQTNLGSAQGKIRIYGIPPHGSKIFRV